MIKINSKQQNIKFSYCSSPITIDKSEDWGQGSIQRFPKGVFLKHNSMGIITHGVKPNENSTAPIGWEMRSDGLYMKKSIWLVKELAVSSKQEVMTLDGKMNYNIDEKSFLVCQDNNGEPNVNDSWVINAKELSKTYILENTIYQAI